MIAIVPIPYKSCGITFDITNLRVLTRKYLPRYLSVYRVGRYIYGVSLLFQLRVQISVSLQRCTVISYVPINKLSPVLVNNNNDSRHYKLYILVILTSIIRYLHTGMYRVIYLTQ